MNTTIQIRIDQATKTKAQKTFKNMGLDLSSGIKYMLTKINNPTSAVYFCDYGYIHRYTPDMLQRSQREERLLLKQKPRFSSVKDMFDDLEK